MERILSQLDGIADEVRSLEDKRKKLGKFLREVKSAQIERDTEILEERIAIEVEEEGPAGTRVAGVDGGLVKKPYHAVDLILTRAVAAVFDYGQDGLDGVSYYPDPLATPELSVITDPYSELEFLHTADIERMETEIDVMLGVRELSPDLILADGSLIPHPSVRPSKGSPVWSRYQDLLGSYRELFKETGPELAGITEDSRSTHFSSLIADKILSKIDSDVNDLQDILARTRDTNLLHHVLRPGERSLVFRLAENGGGDVASDLGEVSNNLYGFYLKTVEYDRPIRVEFYSKGDAIKRAEELAARLLPISSHNEEYGIPGVIIEADSRAKLREEELTTIHSHIVDKVGDLPSLYKLRRDSRPF